MRKKQTANILTKISVGMIASVIILTGVFVWNDNIFAGLMLYEALPNSKTTALSADVPHVTEKVPETLTAEQNIPDFDSASEIINVFVPDKTEEILSANESVSQIETVVTADGEVIGFEEIKYQPESSEEETTPIHTTSAPLFAGWMNDSEYIRKNFYTVDSDTAMTDEDFNFPELFAVDVTIPQTREPKVLIIHTHMYEGYADSDPDNIFDGVFGVGERVAHVLAEKYGISSLHNADRYDVVNGKYGVTEGAYERMEPAVLKILEIHPSVDVVLDIHRDGIDEGNKLLTTVNGVSAAPIMFVNGLSKIKTNGILSPIASLQNPYLKENLAMSLKAQVAANELYPGFARRIYLNAWRYSLNMKARSLLIEVGAQTNTMEEAFAAAEPLADILAEILLNK
ncbi:MAG: stage II sporulation protein P [Clostridiales bacterium]|jgi:stage II sporulation protein P|nr:stage II sporulation protein P [Clostridiales bacterium]